MLLVVALVPAFLGEAHFNAQSYSLNYARTPERRELDYVRQTGASVETAKEVKIFGLNAFLIERYRALADALLRGQPPARRAPRRLGQRCSPRSARSAITWPTPTSSGARCAASSRIGDLTFLAGSFRRLRNAAREPADRLLAGRRARRSISTTCSRSSRSSRRSSRRRMRAPFPRPIREGFVFEDVGFRYPGAERWAVRELSLHAAGRRGAGAGRRERRRQDHAGEAARAALRPGRGPHPARRPRPARVRPRRAARATSASSSRTSCATTSPPPRTSPSAASRRATTAPRIVHAARAQPGRRGDRASCRSGYDQVIGKRFRERRRPVRRRVAEDRDRARLHARRARC